MTGISKAEKLARAVDNVRSGGRSFDRQLAAQISKELRAQAARIAELEADMRDLIKVEVITRIQQQAREDALMEAAAKLYERFHPKNEQSDWTEFAKVHAAVAIEARQLAHALINKEPKL